MKLSTKVDLTPLHTFMDTSMPSLSPRTSGMFKRKENGGNNVGDNKEDSEYYE